jgi:hypothetical protein
VTYLNLGRKYILLQAHTGHDQNNIPKNVRAKVSMNFTLDKYSAPMAIAKIKILGAVLELPAKQHFRFGQFGPILR